MRRIYEIQLHKRYAATPSLATRVQSKQPHIKWPTVWKNINLKVLPQYTKTIWYVIINDIIPTNQRLNAINLLTTSVTAANKRIRFSTDTQLVRKSATYGSGQSSESPASYELMHEIYQTSGFAAPTSRYIRYRSTMPPFGCWGKCSVIYTITTIWPWKITWISSNERDGRNIFIIRDSRTVENIWT
jgi:hypothetical protein